MILAAQLNDSDGLVGFLVVLLLLTFAFVKLIHWMLSGPIRPDPWSEEIAAEIAGDDATPLCHRCLAPHDSMVDFCPDCGAPVGTYTNWLPYPYLFSVGHTLRIGTDGDFKRSPLVIAGFILFGLAEYMLFAPIYWYLLLRNLSRQSRSDSCSGPQSAESGLENPSDPSA